MKVGSRSSPSRGHLRPEDHTRGMRDLWVKGRERSRQTVAEASQVVADFVETFGSVPAKDITIDDLVHFKNMLLQLPKNLSNKEAKLSLTERLICQNWTDHKGVEHVRPKVSAQTVAKKMSLLKAVLGVKVGDGKRSRVDRCWRPIRQGVHRGLGRGNQQDGLPHGRLVGVA